MGSPDARILQLADGGVEQVAYEATEQYQLTRSFLEAPERFNVADDAGERGQGAR